MTRIGKEEKGTWRREWGQEGAGYSNCLICNHFNSLSSTVKRVRKMKGGRLNKNLNASITG